MLVAGLAGIALSSPAWLPFIEYLRETFRPSVGAALQWQYIVPPSALLGLILPSWVAMWDVFTPNPRAIMSIDLANGLVPTAILLTACTAAQRRALSLMGWALLLTGIGLALACLPSIGMFRWSFRWLPLLHLALALAAAQWLAGRTGPEAAPNDRWRNNPGIIAFLAVFFTMLGQAGQPIISRTLPSIMLVLAAVWIGIEDRLPRGHSVRRWAPAAGAWSVLMATYLLLPIAFHVPVWRLDESIRHVAPLDPQIRYFALADERDYFINGTQLASWGSLIRPGNTMSAAGVHFVNGYSPLQLRGMTIAFEFGVHGFVGSRNIPSLALDATPSGGLLDRLGVTGLVVGASASALVKGIQANGWVVSNRGPEGTVLVRPNPIRPKAFSVPAVRWSDFNDLGAWKTALAISDGASALKASSGKTPGTVEKLGHREVKVQSLRRNGLNLDVGAGDKAALVQIDRAWLPGYHAVTSAGDELELAAVDGIALGVWVPADVSGPVAIFYRPRSLVIGFAVAGTTLLLLLAGLLWERRRSRP
jgi:hypothetical protein